jgi:hypothetical protein
MSKMAKEITVEDQWMKQQAQKQQKEKVMKQNPNVSEHLGWLSFSSFFDFLMPQLLREGTEREREEALLEGEIEFATTLMMRMSLEGWMAGSCLVSKSLVILMHWRKRKRRKDLEGGQRRKRMAFVWLLRNF